ncbi:protein of unknown function [Paraburkholderia fungorum]|uniref:DUF4148 domain-containing protein n=1 Tax=Paraburkholderia fungorum TaxID=134537 RepID=A0A1H1H5N8_9BURK|nr:DUF4148 domain-containing protein [Paraburkholderia fungorum]SDR20802.1 protein of unknown function [Paraburkholderia fungorum]
MKSFASLIVATSFFIVPLCGFAQQTNASLTRAEVRAELVQIEKAGYSPATGDHQTYPADIEAAEAKLSTEGTAAATSSVGGSTNRTESGRRHNHAMNDNCVGPASYCTPYFGS